MRASQTPSRAFLETTDLSFRGASKVWHPVTDKDTENGWLVEDQFFCNSL